MTFEQLQKANETLSTMDIKGKNYVQVNERVKAFRMLYPDGTITTDIVSLNDGVVVMQAKVSDEDGKVLATGYAYEKESSTYINKTSYIENCETSAVGRALGFLGIGVDTSIASAEEVQNAINNQDSPKKSAKKYSGEMITDDEADMLENLLIKANVNIEKLCKQYNVDSLYGLTAQQYLDIRGKLGK